MSLSQTAKKLALYGIEQYRLLAANKYFNQKQREYLAIHNQLKPLPQEHAQNVLEYWSKILGLGKYVGGGKLKNCLNKPHKILGWHTAIYNSNAENPADKRYLHNPFYYRCILPYFNDKAYANILADKNYYDCIFSDAPALRPRTIIRRIIVGNDIRFFEVLNNQNRLISKTRALEIVQDCFKNGAQKLIIKPTRATSSGMGKGVRAITADAAHAQSLEQIFALYKDDFIVQDLISQHKWFENLNPKSVNAVRINTFLYRGKVHILPATLYVGDEIVSNGGAYRIGVRHNEPDSRDNGTLRSFIIRSHGMAIQNLPNALQQNFERKIPNFEGIVAAAKDMHLRVPHFGLIGWDFTLDSDGKPMFIELNPDCPSAEAPEFCNEPFFGDLSDEVFEEVARFYMG